MRSAQIGAIHAIAAHSTLNKKEAAIIVMPTGSGKTAVLMMAPFVLAKKKVLVVTPSIMVRGQIYEDYKNLSTLKYIGVLNKEAPAPNVYELKNKYSDDQHESVIQADVVVGTPQVSLSLSENPDNLLFDYIVVDEAHHVPAETWQNILLNMRHAEVLLVTATPFRLDKKEIKGDHIYSYPLSMAYKDGIFGEITYIPIEEAPDKDRLIAIEAERVLLNDRSQKLDHYLMVRTDTKEKSKNLELIYQTHTSLRLKRIDSSTTYNTIKQTITSLKAKEIDGIICVNMLGEGFDFPNLKVAAIHEAHKSLASTLQFIGRFARTNTSNIGSAKFIAMNDERLLVENYRLFSSDSIWQDIILDMSERKIYKDEANKNAIKEFISQDDLPEAKVSLHNVRPNCHAKIYAVSSFNLDNEFPDICGVENQIYRDPTNNTIVGFAQNKTNPIWLEGSQVSDIENLLFIIHYQKTTALLFIYSQIKSEFFYDQIALAFSEEPTKIPRDEMNRVLGKMENYEFYNTGMQNRYSEDGESYRIYSGSNTAASIDETTGKMRSAGHAFCKAMKNDTPVTIGYSSGSKIWSSSYLKLSEYVAWCDECGAKISDSKIVVKTNTNYDLLPLPRKLKKYPPQVFFCFFSDKTYSSPPIVYLGEKKETAHILTDVLIKVIAVNDDSVMVSAEVGGVEELLTCDIEGKYKSENVLIYVQDGRQILPLVDYLSSHPLQFKTTNDAIIVGNEIFEGDPNSIAYSDRHIYGVNWIDLGTNVRKEYGEKTSRGIPIQDTLEAILKKDETYKYIIYDHGTGEVADFITITESESSINVEFFHVKAMKGKQYNSDVNDIYEVLQQAIKSTIWLKTKAVLLQKIVDRRKGGNCIFQRGSLDALKASLRSDNQFNAVIYVVQPSISKSTSMPSKYQEVIAAANFYINHSGRVKELRIWGSV